MTDISVSSSLTAQTVWSANGAALSATLASNAPGIAYFRFNGTATTAIGGYHFTLVEGRSISEAWKTWRAILRSIVNGSGEVVPDMPSPWA